MASKIRVYGKAQNRTCLGIMHAYMTMFPHATLDDIRKSFPNSINPDKGTDEIFIPAEEKGTDANWDGYFKNEDELLTMGDGQKVSVVKMWTKPSFQRAIEQAKLYDIITDISSVKHHMPLHGRRAPHHQGGKSHGSTTQSYSNEQQPSVGHHDRHPGEVDRKAFVRLQSQPRSG